MADATELKALKKPLGDVPQLEEASNNTLAPELAQSNIYNEDYVKIDGRTMRRTNRTVRFATSVTPEFDRMLRQVAMNKNMLLAEVLEQALKLYCNKE